jgi:HEAT repeat protein
MTLGRRFVKLLALIAALTAPALAQQSGISAVLFQFDNEHDLAAKENLLLSVTTQDPGAGPSLLRLAQSTTNRDTRWMSIRGMATLHYTTCAPFLEASLEDSDAVIRANAARALGNLGIKDSSDSLLTMFIAEKDGAAIQQASAALGRLDIKAAVPAIRKTIPEFTGQTRNWLIQALGHLGSTADVPFVAAFLDEMMSGQMATEALQELTGVNFEVRYSGPSGVPSSETLRAQAWWKSHKDAWPRCDDCSRN